MHGRKKGRDRWRAGWADAAISTFTRRASRLNALHMRLNAGSPALHAPPTSMARWPVTAASTPWCALKLQLAARKGQQDEHNSAAASAAKIGRAIQPAAARQKAPTRGWQQSQQQICNHW